ncbi:hypothetical protein AB0L65_32975 [Nonomuraea sp. NPDC052116]|uniref:hypothetical protein n=1 Tax=Nonomuraea sp. NPDC052116 TaxID=3155665 RepID=UPI00341DD0DC
MADLITQAQTRDLFRAKLAYLAHRRSEREQIVEGPDGPEFAWVGYEAGRMLALVNELRAKNGLAPVTLEQVLRIEQSASGHSDYADKYALRCAFLALGEEG